MNTYKPQMLRAYIFQFGRTVDYFDVTSFSVDDEVRKEADKLVGFALSTGKAQRGYYEVQIVDLNNGLLVTDSEDLIA